MTALCAMNCSSWACQKSIANLLFARTVTKKEALQQKFSTESLRLTKMESVEWRVDYLLSSSCAHELNKPSVQLKFNVRDPPPARCPDHDDTQEAQHSQGKERSVAFEATPDKLRVLIHELQAARQLMDSVE
mmetsp:Transcript_4087/g.9784  ORF Transcript_4087/g.9784 Transcript_4087/m.9784 type:complete len:132 (+) Transcript_4087:260-655(+)